jgi:5-deoxy-glucuronate isomerase
MAAELENGTDSMVFRKTDTHLGRHISVTPANSTNRHLCYGRVILKDHVKSVSIDTGERETSFIVLAGSVNIDVNGEKLALQKYDSLYVPRDTAVLVSTNGTADVAEFSAAVEERYPIQVIRYTDVSNNPSLKFSAGTPGQLRHLNILVGKNVNAGRLLVGFTVSEPGNWTSWPPHEHAAMLEEMYVYFDMPAPAFGIQLVYNNTEYPELVTVVRDGDAVLMPSGYHPNVSVPGHSIRFLWAMAAHREKEDRQFGVVNVQAAFGQGGSGLEKSRS